jgi:hypothetical protein
MACSFSVFPLWKSQLRLVFEDALETRDTTGDVVDVKVVFVYKEKNTRRGANEELIKGYALQDFAGLEKLPLRSSSGRRVGIREGILREAFDLRRDSEELAKFPLP